MYPGSIDIGLIQFCVSKACVRCEAVKWARLCPPFQEAHDTSCDEWRWEDSDDLAASMIVLFWFCWIFDFVHELSFLKLGSG